MALNETTLALDPVQEDRSTRPVEHHEARAADCGVVRTECSIGPRDREIHVREVCPGKRSNNTVVVFVHGLTFPANADFDLPVPGYSLAQYLARRGVNCCLFDIRGYGKSYKPGYGEPIGLAQKAEDLSQVCAHLLRDRRAASLVLVGLSTGCNTICELLKHRTVTVHSVIFMGPCYLSNHWLRRAVVRGRFVRLVQTLLGRRRNLYVHFGRKLLTKRILCGEESLIDKRVFDVFLSTAIETSSPGRPYLRTPALSFPERGCPTALWERLFDPQTITCPLLIIRGERDRICCERSARSLADETASPDVRLVTFADRSHDMHLYKNHADVFECILNRVAGTAGGGAA
jgi:alpha-beta hydrolase superfamily lysophospholipase